MDTGWAIHGRDGGECQTTIIINNEDSIPPLIRKQRKYKGVLIRQTGVRRGFLLRLDAAMTNAGHVVGIR